MSITLTKEQEAYLPKYVEDMLKIGQCTARSDRPTAEKYIRKLYSKTKRDQPTFIWMDGPMSGFLAIEIFKDLYLNRYPYDSHKEVHKILLDTLKFTSEPIPTMVDRAISKINRLLGLVVEKSADEIVKNAGSSLSNSFWGQHEIPWVAYYNFCGMVSNCYNLDEKETISDWMEICKTSGWWVPFDYFCFAFERHNVLNLDSTGRCHSETEQSISYPDGWSIYCLHGVSVKPEYVLIDSEKMDPKIVFSEKNAEVRMALIRKIGIERIIQETKSKVLDEWNDYSLISVNLFKGSKNTERAGNQIYLKMQNPSTGTWHVEGVHPDCRTVKEAIHYRKPEKLKSIPIDDENGEDFWQQGDVVMWPKNAKSVKSFPSTLT